MDPHYNPDYKIYLGVDFGWKSNVGVWIQPSFNGDRLLVLFAHYQEYRTNEENGIILNKIHLDRGYGPLTGGFCDPSKPEGARAYSQIFGADILGAPGRVEVGHELFRQWLKAARMTKGESGLVFSRHCPKRLFLELRDYREHQPGIGDHHSLDALRYFLVGWTGA